MMDSAASHVWLPEGNYSKTSSSIDPPREGLFSRRPTAQAFGSKVRLCAIANPPDGQGFSFHRGKIDFLSNPIAPADDQGCWP